MGFNDSTKPPGSDFLNPFSNKDKPGDIPSSFSTPSTQGRQNPGGKGPHSPTYRNPLDPPGFGTKEPLDPAYRNPLDPPNVDNSMADNLFKPDPFKTGGTK